MTLEQLRIFIAVAEREHVTRAAQILNLTQSAVSAAIAALETRHDVRLFDRIGRHIELTAAGRDFLDEARAVLARAAAAEATLADLNGLRHGTLSIAASQTVANYWLPPLLRRFRASYPGITVALAIANTDSVATALMSGTADLGFVEGEVSEPALSPSPVAEDDMVVVAAPDIAASLRDQPLADAFRLVPWVFREPGSGTRVLLEAALRELGISSEQLSITLVLPSNEAVCAAAESGAGLAALSRLVVARSLANGMLVELDFPLPRRRFSALIHRGRFPSRAARAFLDLIEETYAALSRDDGQAERAVPPSIRMFWPVI